MCDPTLEKNEANIKIDAFKIFLEEVQKPMEIEVVDNNKIEKKEGNIIIVIYNHIWCYN